MPSRSPAATTTGHFQQSRRRRARLISLVATTVTLLSVVASTGSPAVAATPHTVQAKASSTTSNPQGLTVAAALTQAKQTKAPVIATAMTTAKQQATANPNGTLTLTQSNQPTRVYKNGAWVNLDPTLTRNPDGSYSPTATPSLVTLSGGRTDALATLSTSGEELDITVPMTLPAPTVSGATATYPNVLPDVDLAVTISDQGGFSDAFVVKTAAAAVNPALASLKLGATSRHLRLTTDVHGGVAAVDSAGHPAYSVAAPIMWDSTPPPASSKATAKTPRALAQTDNDAPVDANSGLPLDSSPTAPGEAAHTAPIGLAASSGGLTLTPSQSLLTASSTVYPVYLDPTLTPDAYGSVEADWLEVQSGYPNTSVWRQSGYQQVGECAWGGCNGMGVARSFFDWNISPLYGTQILSSQVNFTEVWSPACTPPAGHNAAVALEWTGPLNSSQTWNNQPSPFNWTGMDNTSMYGYDPSACPSSGIGFNVTNQVIADVNGQTGVIALGLAAASESDPYGWKLFSNTATLSTTYDVTPAAPTGPFTSPVLPCTTTKPYPIIGKTDLFLYIHTPEAADNVAKPLGVNFGVKNLATGAVVYDQTIQTTAGSGAGTTVPQGTLTSGDYTWDTQSTDGWLTSATSAPCDVTVDTTQPGPPSITSKDYPNGGTDTAGDISKPVRTPGSFEFDPAAGQPTPAAYRYQIDSGVPITVTAGSDGIWKGTITPQHVGKNALSVQALSPAGTPSAATAGWAIVPTPLATPDRDGDFTGDGNPDLLTVGSNAAGGVPPGLWLSAGDGNGHVAPPTDIGVLGTGVNSPGSPSDWNGALVTHGQFTGDKMQDILAIPTDDKPEIFPSPGDGTALQPASETGVPNYDGYLLDPTGAFITSSDNETIIQITAVGHLPTAGGTAGDINPAYPDLIAVVHDTDAGADPNHPYQLWWFQNNGVTGNFNAAVTLDSSIDWSTKTITGTSYQGQPALIVRDNATGAIDLYPTCGTNACDDANWFTGSPLIHSDAATATTAATTPQIASEDANNTTDTNGNPIPDLWAISGGGTVTTSWGDPATGKFSTGAPIAAGNVTANPLTPGGAVRWHNSVSGQDQVDVYATDTNGRLWDYQQQPTNAYLEAPKLVGTGTWNTLTVFGIADWNGDGYPDIVARDNATCAMNVYPGSATGFTATTNPIPIGAGWCGYTPFGVADWYHNGHQDIIAREDATGSMWLYPGDLTGGSGDRVLIGGGFTAGTYDPDGLINFDGATDASGKPANELVIRRNTDHTLQLFRGTGTNNALTGSGTTIGTGFTTDNTYVGFIHYNSSTEPDLITRQPNTHNLQLFEATGTGTWTDGLGTTLISSGW